MHRKQPTFVVAVATLLTAAAVHLTWPATSTAAEGGIVKLELVGEGHSAALAFQKWARALAGAGIRNVRFRSARSDDRVGVETRELGGRKMYIVTGIVRGETELILPTGRLRRSEVGRLKSWLDDLARLGPASERPARGAFGLTATQYAELREDLAQPVAQSTKDRPRAEVVQEIARGLDTRLTLAAADREALQHDAIRQTQTELRGVAAGTALAFLLRPAGLSLVPAETGAGVALDAVRARPGMEIWPIGRDPEQPTRDVLPALYEFRDVNVQNVAAERVYQAIAGQLKVPVLVDLSALARHGIDPAEAKVSLPRSSRTTYSLVLKKALFQAGLKAEVRLDEADRPLLWVTSLKPL